MTDIVGNDLMDLGLLVTDIVDNDLMDLGLLVTDIVGNDLMDLGQLVKDELEYWTKKRHLSSYESISKVQSEARRVIF